SETWENRPQTRRSHLRQQSNVLFPQTNATAVRLPDRPHLHRGGAGYMLAAQPRRPAHGGHPPHTPSRGTVGIGIARRGGAEASASGSDGWIASASVRWRGQPGTRETISAFGAWPAEAVVRIAIFFPRGYVGVA